MGKTHELKFEKNFLYSAKKSEHVAGSSTSKKEKPN